MFTFLLLFLTFLRSIPTFPTSSSPWLIFFLPSIYCHQSRGWQLELCRHSFLLLCCCSFNFICFFSWKSILLGTTFFIACNVHSRPVTKLYQSMAWCGVTATATERWGRREDCFQRYLVGLQSLGTGETQRQRL